MTKDDKDDLKSVVEINGEYFQEMKDIQKLVLGGNTDLMDVALFAWSIGVNKGLKLEKGKWNKGASKNKTNPLSPLANYQDINEIRILMEAMGSGNLDIKFSSDFNEYVNGGLKFLVEQEFNKGKIERFMKTMEKTSKKSANDVE